jgi:hypothetical protein
MSSKISKEDLAELRSIFVSAQGDNLGRNHVELSRLIIPLTNAFPALIAEVEEARDLIQEVDHIYDWLLRGSPECGCGDCRQCWGDRTAERTQQYLREIAPVVKTLISTGTTKFSHDKRSLVIEQDGKEIRIERADLPEGLAAMTYVACKEQVSGADIKKHCASLDVAPDYLKDLPF